MNVEWTERPFLRQWVKFHFIGRPFVRRSGWGCSLIRGVGILNTNEARPNNGAGKGKATFDFE